MLSIVENTLVLVLNVVRCLFRIVFRLFLMMMMMMMMIIFNRNLYRAVSMKIVNCALHKKLIKDGIYNLNLQC